MSDHYLSSPVIATPPLKEVWPVMEMRSDVILTDPKLKTVQVMTITVVGLLIWLQSALPAYSAVKRLTEQTTENNSRQWEDELRPGKTIEREITSGKSHTYRLSLRSGQYLNLTVEQLGINVEIALSDPKGGQLMSLDWWWREGTESLWALAESTGDYIIRVGASNHPSETGRYRMKVEGTGEWQDASAMVQDYVAAYQKFTEGEKLASQSTEESLTRASQKFQESLTIWRRIKQNVGEAQTLNELAGIEYKAGRLKPAIDFLNQSLALFRAAGNHRGEVISLNDLGAMSSFSGETQKALGIYNEALPLVRTIKDYETEANILAGIGSVQYRLGQASQALETFKEVVSLSHEHELIDGEAVAHNNIGAVLASQGRFREALLHYNNTLTLLERSNDRMGQAATLSNIGTAYGRMGEFQHARDSLLRALSLRRLTGDRRGEAIDLGSIGDLHTKVGDYASAREFLEKSLSLSREIGNRLVEAGVLANLGIVYGFTGDWQKAIEDFNQSLVLRRQSGDRNGEGYVLQNLGSIYNRMGETDKALEYFEKALSVRRAVGDQYGESYTLLYLGDLHLRRGDQAKALEYTNAALALSRASGDRLGEAAVLYQLAQVDRNRGNLKEARSRIEAALDFVETTRAKVDLANVRNIYFASRQDYYDFYIDLLMQLYRAEKNVQYLADALHANERRRARSLLDSLAESHADIRSSVPQPLIERERRLQQDLNAKADQQVRLLSRKHTSEEAGALAKAMESLTTEYEQVVAEIRQTSPRYAALTQPVALSLKQIQEEELDANTVLLEYSLGKEKSYVWAVSATDVTVRELPKREEIESLARRVYELLTARNRRVGFETVEERRARISKADAEYEAAADDLSKMILIPVATQIIRKRLLIVSDGALQYLPFAVLPAPDGPRRGLRQRSVVPLVALHEIASLPSATTLAVLRKEIAGRNPAPRAIAVLADPVFSKDDDRLKMTKPIVRSGETSTNVKADPFVESALTRSISDLTEDGKEIYFPRLPFTRREAEALMRLAPEKQNKKATDFAANKTMAINPELSQYRYLHFATHTILNSKNPGFSGILWSLFDERGADRDGFLTANEIYNLKLPADLVVLSSCKTGLGKEIKGEGIIGITRAFMYAGAARVLVSLWDVDDESTVEIMKSLYEAMLKKRLSPTAALRASQVSMLKSSRWRAPYFWAAFVLQGEYK